MTTFRHRSMPDKPSDRTPARTSAKRTQTRLTSDFRFRGLNGHQNCGSRLPLLTQLGSQASATGRRRRRRHHRFLAGNNGSNHSGGMRACPQCVPPICSVKVYHVSACRWCTLRNIVQKITFRNGGLYVFFLHFHPLQMTSYCH